METNKTIVIIPFIFLSARKSVSSTYLLVTWKKLQFSWELCALICGYMKTWTIFMISARFERKWVLNGICGVNSGRLNSYLPIRYVVALHCWNWWMNCRPCFHLLQPYVYCVCSRTNRKFYRNQLLFTSHRKTWELKYTGSTTWIAEETELSRKMYSEISDEMPTNNHFYLATDDSPYLIRANKSSWWISAYTHSRALLKVTGLWCGRQGGRALSVWVVRMTLFSTQFTSPCDDSFRKNTGSMCGQQKCHTVGENQNAHLLKWRAILGLKSDFELKTILSLKSDSWLTLLQQTLARTNANMFNVNAQWMH